MEFVIIIGLFALGWAVLSILGDWVESISELNHQKARQLCIDNDRAEELGDHGVPYQVEITRRIKLENDKEELRQRQQARDANIGSYSGIG